MEREGGGGIGMGNTCKSMADSFQCMTKLLQKKKKKKQGIVITLPAKVHLIKAMVFPVVMYGCESWTIEKAEHRRNDAFELWCWRRLLRVP